jgi:hypothetical protein
VRPEKTLILTESTPPGWPRLELKAEASLSLGPGLDPWPEDRDPNRLAGAAAQDGRYGTASLPDGEDLAVLPVAAGLDVKSPAHRLRGKT